MNTPFVTWNENEAYLHFNSVPQSRDAGLRLEGAGMSGLASQFEFRPCSYLVFTDRETAESALEILRLTDDQKSLARRIQFSMAMDKAIEAYHEIGHGVDALQSAGIHFKASGSDTEYRLAVELHNQLKELLEDKFALPREGSFGIESALT